MIPPSLPLSLSLPPLSLALTHTHANSIVTFLTPSPPSPLPLLSPTRSVVLRMERSIVCYHSLTSSLFS